MAPLWLGPGNNAWTSNSPSICFDKAKPETLEGACGSFIALHYLPHHFPARIKHLIEWIPVPPPPDPTCCPVLDDPQELVHLLTPAFIHLPLQSNCTWCLRTAECSGVKPHSPRDYFTHVLGQIIADFKQYKAWVQSRVWEGRQVLVCLRLRNFQAH